MPKTNDLPVEIFSPGTWNGMPFRLADLQAMVANFSELREVHKVPLKFGHNNEQPFTDGQPALGWVDEVYVATGKDGKPKLMARFTDMPEIVYNSIKRGLYRKVSVELDLDVSYKGKRFDYVLSGVALLGADLPAVNNLADLQAYMSREDVFAATRRACFTAITNPPQEEQPVDMKELQAQLEAIQSKQAELAAENATLKTENAKFSADAKAREAAEAQRQRDEHAAGLTGLLEAAVKDGRILPANREAFTKALHLTDLERVMHVSKEDVQAMIDTVAKPSKNFSRDTTHHEQHGAPTDEDPGVVLTREAQKIRAKNQGMSFSRALEQAQRANPELAAAHMKSLEE